MFHEFVSWSVDGDIGSDHYPIRATFSSGSGQHRSSHSYRNIKDTNWEEFRERLQYTLPESPKTAQELDDAVHQLTQQIANAFEMSCPKKTNRYPNSKPLLRHMINLIKEKRKLRREKAEAKASGDMTTVRQLQQQINKKNNDFKKQQKIQEKEKLRKYCHELNQEKDSAKFFKLLRQSMANELQRPIHAKYMTVTNLLLLTSKRRIFLLNVSKVFIAYEMRIYSIMSGNKPLRSTSERRNKSFELT